MKTSVEIILEKFDELIGRGNKQFHAFTRTERVVWLIMLIRCDLDMSGFSAIFEQSVTREELVEAIEYMRELNIPDIADGFEQALALLDKNNWYEIRGNDWIAVELPSEDEMKFKAIGIEVKREQKLWGKQVNDGLVQMLMDEKNL